MVFEYKKLMIPYFVKILMYRILPDLLHMSFSNATFCNVLRNFQKKKSGYSIKRRYFQYQYNALTLKKEKKHKKI